MLCPCCRHDQIRSFHRVEAAPVNSMVDIDSAEEARAYPTGTLDLAVCERCAFIFNQAFDEGLVEYSDRYNPSQAASATFNRWHRGLAESLIERFSLRKKRVVEIGCGQGEFLTLLAECGDNECVGYDPMLTGESTEKVGEGSVRLLGEKFTAETDPGRADFICCKMTLEHIKDVRGFVQMVRQALLSPRPDGDEAEPLVFFQVPSTEHILSQTAFWDVYYEHCSYFTADSLKYLFKSCGYQVVDVQREYDGQYLALTAHPKGGEGTNVSPTRVPETLRDVEKFQARLTSRVTEWRDLLAAEHAQGHRTVVWGAGSKAVSFLGMFPNVGIDAVVDINPRRQGNHLPGSALEVIPPEALRATPADTVVIMNSVYATEIKQNLADLGLSPQVLCT